MNLIRNIILIGMTLMLGGCVAGRDSGRDAIAVSFEPQAWMAREIAGDDFDIITLLPGGTDPEVYQPSISTMRRLGDASAYLTLGTDGFEKSLGESIRQNFPDLKIADSGAGTDKIYGTHGDHHDGSDSFDPHLLASLRNCVVIAGNIAETLASIRPDKAAEYRAAGRRLQERLQALDDSIAGLELGGRAFVSRHPSLSYFARDYRLNQIALNGSGKEISPMQLKQRIDSTAALHPAVMIVEKEHAYSSDGDIARSLGIDTIVVSLNSSSWIDDIIRISHEIDRN